MSDPAATVGTMDDLTDLERRILEFEGRRWNYQGVKDDAVLREFGMSRWRYQQHVLAVIRKPAALVAQPQLVNRLRRLQVSRRWQREYSGVVGRTVDG